MSARSLDFTGRIPELLRLMPSTDDHGANEAVEITIGPTIEDFANTSLTGYVRVGQVAQGLTEWHAVVRAQCSELYTQLRMSEPEASREVLNSKPELFALNAARKAIRRERNWRLIRRSRF